MEFILYAALFRLAVIAAGTACVFMGYRLFVLGVMPLDGSEIDASAGEIRLSVKNAAPGTCFALFGVLIIGLMLWQGNPEFRGSEVDAEGTRRDVVMRGGDALEKTMRTAQSRTEAGDHQAAIRLYAELLSDPDLTLGLAARPLLGLASIYYAQERYEEALAYARLVSQVQTEDPDVLTLIAGIEAARGNHDAAIEVMQEAVDLDPRRRPELLQMEELRKNE